MDYPDIPFFNPYQRIQTSVNRLPHWQQAGATYFVTFRLGDSLPPKLLRQWESAREAWLLAHPQPWNLETEEQYHRRFTNAMDRWLDAGYGSCALADPACSVIVRDAVRHFDAARCALVSFVVMPNHVHVLFVQHPDWPLEKLLHSWKRHSAREINALRGRSGKLWQKDYYDRLVRDEVHFRNCVRYIRRNPVRARLAEGSFLLHESALLQ